MKQSRLLAATVVVTACAGLAQAADLPESGLDTRMKWFREAKFGMFIHWGLYAIPARGEWVMNKEKIPVEKYAKYADEFNPVKFNAEEWVRVAKDAGMKYMVVTAKHHDGFAMFGSKVSAFNIVDATPFKRDPLKELAAACQKDLYFTLLKWPAGEFTVSKMKGTVEKAYLLADLERKPLGVSRDGGTLTVSLPETSSSLRASVLCVELEK